MKIVYFLFIFFLSTLLSAPKVQLGVDLFFQEGGAERLKGKKIGLITNHTGINGELRSTIELFKEQKECLLKALFAPEHGINGFAYARENVDDVKIFDGVDLFSLHGATRRPTEKMLEGIDLLVYDIQDIGCRSYTYATTLYYAMEEAAKYKIPVMVFDRPNPINGVIVDGPMLDSKWRSFIGYINVPYCHGMTIGELATLFNAEYKIGCDLTVIKMRGWKRSMSFKDTGLSWIPTSPFVPEAETPIFYATTGILGELNLVNLGGGYNLPFKVVGAPWIEAAPFAKTLNAQKLPGVHFIPFYYRPFFGAHKGIDCQGVMVIVTDPIHYRPLNVQYLLLGVLKTLHPKKMREHLSQLEKSRKQLFCKATGNEEILHILETDPYPAWKLINYQKEACQKFISLREKYLLY